MGAFDAGRSAEEFAAWVDDGQTPEDASASALIPTFRRVDAAIGAGDVANEALSAVKARIWASLMAADADVSPRVGAVAAGAASSATVVPFVGRTSRSRAGIWQRVVSAALIAAMVIGALGLVWLRLANDGGTPDDDELSLAAADMTVIATPTVSIDPETYMDVTCDAPTRTSDERARVLRTVPTNHVQEYLPFIPADPDVAVAVSRAQAELQVCGKAGRGDDMKTDWFVFSQENNTYFRSWSGMEDVYAQRLQGAIDLSQTYQGVAPISFYILGSWEGVQWENLYGETSFMPAVDPKDVVMLPDGRAGAIMTYFVNEDSLDGASIQNDPSQVSLNFIIFAHQDGRWLFDELLSLCTLCASYGVWNDLEAYYAPPEPLPWLRPESSPIAIPETTGAPAGWRD